MADTKKYLHNLDVSNNKVENLLLNPLTTAQRLAVGGTLGLVDEGYSVFDTTSNELYFWDGTTWILSSGVTTWGSITGTITSQTDLISYLSANYYPLTSNPANYLTAVVANTLYYPLSSNPAGYLTSSSISGMVTGSGTLNYVPKWTPTGVQLGDSQIYDDGNYVRVGTGGGSMGFPYEKLILEAPQDMKFGSYTSVTAPNLGGASYVLGYTNFTTNLGYYPGFEFQMSGAAIDADNLIRYNFLQRNAAGTVVAANPNIFNIYADARASFKTLIGTGTEMVVADASGFISRQAIPVIPTNPVTGTGVATRVAFWDTSSSISSDTNLYWDNTNKYLGIGTATPTKALDVSSDAKVNGALLGIGPNSGSAFPNTNIVFGTNALAANTTGYYNAAIGTNAMNANTTGYYNLAIGYDALKVNLISRTNIAIGATSLGKFIGDGTINGGNTGIGALTLRDNVTGLYNTAIGYGSILSITGSSFNNAIGYSALRYATSGNYNTAIGTYAGSYYGAPGTTTLTTVNNGTFIGYYTRSLNNSSTNEIVIGYNAVGNGDNTTTIGNSGTISTNLFGSLGFGSTPSYGTTGQVLTSQGSGVAPTWATAVGALRSGIAAGTDTYTVTISGVTSYAVNDTYVIQFTNGNTGASTLNINGLGAINLFKYNDVPVLAGDIGGGHQFIVSYDGTNFELIGVRPNQLFAFITNDDSVTINKGQPVYAFGAAGNRMSVKLAANTADATSAKTLGLVFSSSIAPNQTGFIIIQGVIENINTAAYSAGNTLYLGATAGTLTNVKPYAPNHLVYIGIVERANAGNGQIYVRTQNGYELDEIHDVDLISTPPTNNQVLAYETSSGLWKNKSLSALGAGTVTSVSASMVTPAQTVSVTNPTTTPAISIDDTNLLYNKFMVNQYSYLFPSDANTLWDTLRVGGTILSTGTVSALSETPMGQLFTTATAVGSVASLFGTSFGGSGYLGTNFEFDFSYRFRINTNNGAQRLFCGVSSQYATATPTNVEPTTLINSIGVAKLQATANLYFVWNDATGTASSLDLGSGFLGTDTSSTYRMRIYKTSGSASINLELTKVTSGGTVTVTSLNITSDYNTGSTMYPVIWMGNNTAATGAVSFKNYGCQINKRGLVNA